MKPIKSRLAFKNLIGPIISMSVLAAGATTLSLLFFIDVGLTEPPTFATAFSAVICGLGFLFCVFYSINITKKITINSEGVIISTLFKESIISWSEIKMIWRSNNLRDGDFIRITTTDLKKHKIYIDMYANQAELNQIFDFIEENLMSGKVPDFNNFDYIKPVIVTATISELSSAVYGKNKLTFSNLILIIFIIFLCILIPFIFTAKGVFQTLIISSFCAVLLIALWSMVSQSCYIVLNDNYLQVKHPLGFTNATYQLTDIQSITIYYLSRFSMGIKVATTGYHSGVYACCNMRNSDWRKFIAEIECRGITFKNSKFFKR